MYRVIITGPAERDIQSAYDWWAQNRSEEQAKRWYVGLQEAIYSLNQMPDRCSLATEISLHELCCRQLHFGLGPRPTHRAIFAIEGDDVVVLRVRHAAQDVLSTEDLG